MEDLVQTERLKLRDKALPDRLVITSLVCDSIVIVYALIFSFWFRFQTPIIELGVPSTVLERHGAVSRETAEAMARGAVAHAPVDLAVSITGIAGPGGATAGKPIGLVHFAAASRDGRLIQRERRYGDVGRAQVRRASVHEALAMLGELAAQE